MEEIDRYFMITIMSHSNGLTSYKSGVYKAPDISKPTNELLQRGYVIICGYEVSEDCFTGKRQ